MRAIDNKYGNPMCVVGSDEYVTIDDKAIEEAKKRIARMMKAYDEAQKHETFSKIRY